MPRLTQRGLGFILLRQQRALPAAKLDAMQAGWAAQSLQEAGDANALADRWDALPQALRTSPEVVAAYAQRAAALRWDEAATRSLEQALDAQWNEELAALYGVLPDPASRPTVVLKPALSLVSKVVYFKVVKAGRTVSYGATWTASEDTRVITGPIGYGDGYPRSLSSRGEVLVRQAG